ncbi:unknown protein [Waddlia chondrophila 2032/99]|uniref:Uncharacterized protein n=1 Tax=Waddlia chondrophila 2032/99 TaxID=765953 RepID=F8LE75_9BACT|nr:unknown protein [Waddlia chondrophila 2032/99]
MPLDDVFAGFLGIDVNVVDLLDEVADGVVVVALAGVYVAKEADLFADAVAAPVECLPLLLP